MLMNLMGVIQEFLRKYWNKYSVNILINALTKYLEAKGERTVEQHQE